MSFDKKNGAKGVVDIEFMVSILIFLTVLTFVTFSVIGLFPRLHEEAFAHDIRSKAFQVSELLMFDRGEPTDWDTAATIGDVKRLGFSTGGNYTLDRNKINKLNTFCSDPSNYAALKSLLGLDYTNDIIIDIKEPPGPGSAILAACQPLVVSQVRSKTSIVRLGVDSSDKTKIIEMAISIM